MDRPPENKNGRKPERVTLDLFLPLVAKECSRQIDNRVVGDVRADWQDGGPAIKKQPTVERAGTKILAIRTGVISTFTKWPSTNTAAMPTTTSHSGLRIQRLWSPSRSEKRYPRKITASISGPHVTAIHSSAKEAPCRGRNCGTTMPSLPRQPSTGQRRVQGIPERCGSIGRIRRPSH